MDHAAKAPEMWLIADTLPTLGEARGKLVLLRRYGDESFPGVEFDWSGQGGGNDGKSFEICEKNGFSLAVQDRYEYDVEEKWAAFTDTLGARADLTLNFLSTKGSFVQGHPFFFASNLNPRLKGADPKGWTIVDFGTAEIAKTIYERNFK
jgi:1-phosphatidylinositol phosphodiesterase